MLEALKLSKRYDTHAALSDLNLTIAGGEVFCLLGANGAGKTTTINLFLNFIQPSGGRALINGRLLNADIVENQRPGSVYLAGADPAIVLRED